MTNVTRLRVLLVNVTVAVLLILLNKLQQFVITLTFISVGISDKRDV